MASTIDILAATEEDLPTLAHITTTAMDVDLLHRVIFPSNNPADQTIIETAMLGAIRSVLKNPHSHAFKAVSKETGDIAGYGLLTFTDPLPVKKGAEQETPKIPEYFPEDGVNVEFLKRLARFFNAQREEHFSGKRHVWWSNFMVLPTYQSHGIGKALFQYALHSLKADTLPIGLFTQERVHGMYLKFGFQDLAHDDVDMAEFMGPHKGFGMHRNYVMIRWPGGVAGPDQTKEIDDGSG